VIQKDTAEVFLASFAFRSGQHLLTAAHCVGDLAASALSLTLPEATARTTYRWERSRSIRRRT
jgi:hypothetical protein